MLWVLNSIHCLVQQFCLMSILKSRENVFIIQNYKWLSPQMHPLWFTLGIDRSAVKTHTPLRLVRSLSKLWTCHSALSLWAISLWSSDRLIFALDVPHDPFLAICSFFKCKDGHSGNLVQDPVLFPLPSVQGEGHKVTDVLLSSTVSLLIFCWICSLWDTVSKIHLWQI